jgi:tetratricopeptide (TPR) repeat protein
VAAPLPAKPKKSKKKLFIIIGAVVLVILIAVGSIVGYNIYRSSTYDSALEAYYSGDYQKALDTFDKLGDYKDSGSMAFGARQNLDYNAAQALFEAEDYEGAKAAFTALGDFQDSADMVIECERNIDYLAATKAFNADDFDGARTTFSELASTGFKDASTWVDKCDYAIADELFNDGDYYGAYEVFMALGSFEDSADRMDACTTAYPGTGETYHNGDYVSARSSIVLNCGNVSAPNYFKIYSGDTLVASFFVNGGGSCEIELPAGTYSIKQASGSAWFGEDIMFGDEGWYEIMTFNGGATSFDLGDNIISTITLAVGSDFTGDRVGADSTDRENF